MIRLTDPVTAALKKLSEIKADYPTDLFVARRVAFIARVRERRRRCQPAPSGNETISNPWKVTRQRQDS